MRIALGAFTHEANSFSAHATDMDDFRRRELAYGGDVIAGWQARHEELAGAMSILTGRGDCEILPLLAARALAAAPVVESVYRAILDDLLARLEAVLPVDGVLLVLHGSMMAEGTPDGTGEVLARVRELVGPGVPIAGTLDLHANVTELMAASADILIGYHTSPHVDQYQTARKAAQTLLATIDGQISPRMALARMPWISSSENCTDQWGPLSELLAMADELERTGEILHAGIYPVQAWLDTPDVASSVVVLTDGDQGAAERHAETLAGEFWSRRAQFVPTRVPPDEAIRLAMARPSGTVVFCDSADSTTSGATGDSTTILAAVLQAAPLEHTVLLNVVDAEAVAQAIDAGVGATLDLDVGGKLGTTFYRPVRFRGRVKLISDGDFVPRSGAAAGSAQHRGRSVLLAQGNIRLVVSEQPASQWHPAFYRSMGEEPADARIVQIKSPMGYRAAYADILDEVILVDAPGASTPDLASLPWRNLPRPIYPVDLDAVWP